MVPWLEYINNILTPEILVVEDTERVILDEPGFLKNLTEILKRTPKRTIANYMFFRAASSSLGFFTEAARKVQEDYSQELTGTTSKVGKSQNITNISTKTFQTPRWKQCVGTASGIFSSVVGHLYVKKHFKEEATRRQRLHLLRLLPAKPPQQPIWPKGRHQANSRRSLPKCSRACPCAK